MLTPFTIFGSYLFFSNFENLKVFNILYSNYIFLENPKDKIIWFEFLFVKLFAWDYGLKFVSREDYNMKAPVSFYHSCSKI
jgi:hypothetical protein